MNTLGANIKDLERCELNPEVYLYLKKLYFNLIGR